jgi:hypothetical protein
MDGGMLHKAWDGAWHPSPTDWESLGGKFTSRPAVASWGPNRLDVFGLGTDNNAMHHIAWDGGSWGWDSLGGGFTSPPAVASWGPNRLDVFGRGTDNSMYHGWWDGGSWQLWENLTFRFTGPPAVASSGPNRLDVFGIGMDDNQMYHAAWDSGSWAKFDILQGWQPLGGKFTSPPMAVSWGPNRLDIFGLGVDSGMYHKAWDGAWHPSPFDWEGRGGVFR